MIYLNCDYNEGAHPQVLAALADTNMQQHVGYGEDPHCERARDLIRAAAGVPQAEVQFLVGGTQANAVVIAALLRPHQGALCADSGHINVHETGAIEATGHKVLAMPSADGKITAQQVREAMTGHWPAAQEVHMVQPGMVYISFPTEVGTLYTKRELTELYDACREMGLPLFIDGARLGYGLTAPDCDITLEELAARCDVFTVGGTKVGALFGEAVVFSAPALAKDFRYIIKQRGGMLAKGRLLGVQFEALFENGLYFDIAKTATARALWLKKQLQALGLEAAVDSPTNQQFFLLPQSLADALAPDWNLSDMGLVADGRRQVRICVSWATAQKTLEDFVQAVRAAL